MGNVPSPSSFFFSVMQVQSTGDTSVVCDTQMCPPLFFLPSHCPCRVYCLLDTPDAATRQRGIRSEKKTLDLEGS